MTDQRASRTTAAEAEALDEGSLTAIRSILHDQEAEPNSRKRRAKAQQLAALPDPVEAEPEENTKRRKISARLKRFKPKRRTNTHKETNPQTSDDTPNVVLRVLGHPMAQKAVLVVSLMLIAYVRPWLFFGTIALLLLLCIGVLFAIGQDGVWQRALAAAKWFAHRRPQQAAVIHRKLNAFADVWDSILDRFPEGTVDALYLPDLGKLAEADQAHADVFDRRLT